MNPTSDKVLFSARGVVKNYGHVRALDDVSISVRPGEVFGLVGDNRIACSPINAGSCMLRYG